MIRALSLTRQILSSSAQLTMANALGRVLGLISLPLLTHWLAPDAYGQAALAATLISLVSVIGLMGMEMSYARAYLSRNPPNGEQVERFCWRFAVVAALVAAAVAAAVWLVHAYQNATALPALALWVALGAGGSLLQAMAQARSRLHNQYGRLALAIAMGGLLATTATLVLAKWFTADAHALVTGYVAAYFVPIAIMGLPAWRQLRTPSGLTLAARKAVFRVGLPGVITSPMFWVLSSSDRWFLQASMDATTVGVYAVAGTFGQLGLMVNSALLAIWLPEATRVHESVDVEEGGKMLATLIIRLVAVMMLIWVGIATLGGDVLRWLSEDRFHSGAAVVPWLASSIFFYGCYHLFNTGLFLGRRLKLSAGAWLLAGVLSLTANACLVPRFGMLAAAGVQCATFAFLASLVFWLAQKHHPIPLPRARMLAMFLLGTLFAVSGAGLPPIAGWGMAGAKVMAVLAFAVLLLLVHQTGPLRHRFLFLRQLTSNGAHGG